MDTVRMGIIGVGNMGTGHAKYILDGAVKNCKLTAVCDLVEAKIKNITDQNPDVIGYKDYKEMINSGKVDAVIVATEHYVHPEICIYAFEHRLHVISEKPVGVYCNQVLKMNDAAKKSGKVFSSMFCVRTNPMFAKVRELVQSGEIGAIKRVNWIATDWYRPQFYHDSAKWRSSWKGEGGGVLVNQSPHNLDMIQWIFGMPESVTSFVSYGKYYNIEVEDEATAYLKYKDFSCLYIASTGEAPGTNRIEIAGDNGRIVVENGKILFNKNEMSEREFNRINKSLMPVLSHTDIDVPFGECGNIHASITQNFVNAILNGEELIAPGLNGLNEVTLSNAIHLSSWTNETVTLPMDNDKFEKLLSQKISGGNK